MTQRLLTGLQVNESAMSRNLAVYGPFAAIERVLMALAKEGADRQEMHERLRQHAMQAWSEVQAGQANPLEEQIAADEQILALPGGGKVARPDGCTCPPGRCAAACLETGSGCAAGACQDYGTGMISSRLGPVDTRLTRVSSSSSTLRTYICAWRGRRSNWRISLVDCIQPSISM